MAAESLDRLSHDQADVATLHKHLAFLGSRLWTVAEGQINELHVGSGHDGRAVLKELAQKRHRAWRVGSAAACRVAGSATATIWAAGVWKINQAEAAVVFRIFEERAVGRDPRAIAAQLNKEKVRDPRGGTWRDTTIRGHFTRGIGILNNEAYIGRRVWDRLRFPKNPATGRRRPRRNDSERVIVE